MSSNLTLRIIECLVLGGVAAALIAPLFVSSDENKESQKSRMVSQIVCSIQQDCGQPLIG